MGAQTPEMTAEAAQALFTATRALTETILADPRWDAPRAALLQARETPRPCEAQGLPVLRWLDGATHRAALSTRKLCTALEDAAARLPWRQTYRAEDLGPAFLERYGFMELVGQRGPFASDTIACGFLLLGPDLHYPRHRHEAEEIYIVLSGTAHWLKGDGAYLPQPPGNLIHHPSWCWHAMRTGEQPLLAFYIWQGGNLVQKSEIAKDD